MAAILHSLATGRREAMSEQERKRQIEEVTEKETKIENVRDRKGRRGAGKEESKTGAFCP